MNESLQVAQPHSYTDFNDLHVNFGLEEVKAQFESALSSFVFSPAPPNNFDNNFQGQMPENTSIDEPEPNSCENMGGAGGGIYLENVPAISEGLNIDQCLARFCLIEGMTKFWDMHRKREIKKTAFVDMLGKELFKKWTEHPKRKLIDPDAVKSVLNADANKIADDISGRFIMLEGTLESWDTVRRERVKNATIKENFNRAFDIWIKSDKRKMIYHKDLVFNPTMQIHEGQINMFDGLPMAPMLNDIDQMIPQASSAQLCGPFISLLKHLCGDEMDVVRWILQWLAYPLQNQGAKMATSILVHGEVQGAGKSLFFGKIMQSIYGRYGVTLGQNGLESIYTDWAEQKLYCLFEEIFNNKSKFGMMGLIKHMITGETIRIDKKFMSGYEQSNHINCVFLSNDTQPLPLEERDRRFLVVWPESKLSAELKNQVMECIDNGGIQAFYTYLLQIPLNNFGSHTEPPMTKAKEKIINYGLPNWKLFLQQWCANELVWPYQCCLSQDLFGAYMAWCRQNNEKPLPSNKFLGLLSSQPGISKRHGRFYEKNGYALSTKEVQKMLVYVGEKSADMKMIDWLTSQVHGFSAKLIGDVPDAL